MPPSQKFSGSKLSSSKLPISAGRLQTGLQVLGSPRVWGSVLILLVASYGLFQYWGSSGQSANQDAQGTSAINPARRNPLLGSEQDFSSPDLSSLPVSNGSPQPYVVPGVPAASPKAAGSLTRPNTFNPFTIHAITAGQSGSDALNLPSAAPGTPAGSANPGSVSGSAERPATVRPVSPLQSGLDRNFSVRQFASEPNGSSPAASTVGNLAGGNSTEPTLSPVGASQFQPYVPRISPPPGSTGYTLPPAFRTPANSGSSDASGFNSFSRPQPLPGFTSTQPRQSVGSQSPQSQSPQSQSPQYQSPQYQPPQSQSPQYQPQTDPFSVPRTAPGRSIGGGQINTFSNP